MRAAPYNLVKDDSVFVKLVSINVYGESVQSSADNGAVIQYVPDAPVSLTNLPAITDAFKIGLSWSAGASDGGTAVIDYKILYALENEALTELTSGITDTTYTTSATLVAGENYVFKVLARNTVGYSLESE